MDVGQLLGVELGAEFQGFGVKVVAFLTEYALMEAMRTSKAAVVDRIYESARRWRCGRMFELLDG
jgi:hypothetical protein